MTLRLHRGAAAVLQRRLTPEPERLLPTDPARWIRDELSEHLWSRQREIVASVVANRYTAVQSGHGVGKSYIAARLAAWWIAGHPPGEAMVVTSAPSGDQIRKILWGELRKAHRKGGLPGDITQGAVPEWKIDGEVVAFGRKPQDYVDAEQAMTVFQGIHARYLLVVLDEAAGIPKWLWDATMALVTNEAARVLAIGNPTDPTSEFATRCAPGGGFHTIKISVFDSPNFTGERVPEQLREELVSPMWVEERQKDWGEGTPMYVARVLGEFPEESDDVLIPPRLVQRGYDTDRSGHALVPGQLGWDIAEKGADESVIYRDRGGWLRLVAAWRKADTYLSTEKARTILEALGGQLWRGKMVGDSVGLGAGPVSTLRNEGYPVIPFNGGAKAVDSERFVNARAEAWWGFRDDLEAGLIDLDPDDELLAAQLQQPRWGRDPAQRRIRLETKDEMAKRGLKSPDRADAAVMSRYKGTPVGDPSNVLAGPDEMASITAGLLDLQT